jgi:cellulose synthase/poly-beta-1,6-N-acetylglucosamine synthase-like glycosyltransferase
MIALALLQVVATAYATVWALYLLVFLAAASVLQPRARVNKHKTKLLWPTLAIIVPAHNMAHVIAQCIGSLLRCHYPQDNVTIYVVADHCTDDTAVRAEAMGATALTREDGLQGKTYTLAWSIDMLTQRSITPDLYVITDATVQVGPYFLTALAEGWQRGEDIITSCATVSPANQKWYARCLGLMLVHRNLQGWCRERLGLSAWLEGRGMAYSREYIQRFGWHLALPTGPQSSHPTEDWRHGVRIVEQGYRVAFTSKAAVVTPLRNSLVAATQQGARWERGRLINAGTHALRLLSHGLKQRELIKICAALDAIQPPVALLAALTVVLAVPAMLFPRVSWLGLWAFVPFILTGLYGIIVVLRGYREGIHVVTMLWAPIYIVWRCTSFVLAWVFLDRLGPLGRPKKQSRHLQ